MKREMKLMWTGFVLAGLAIAAYAQAPVARWNLGEQDTGAAAGNPGDAFTKDAIGTNDLAANGAPLYSANGRPILTRVAFSTGGRNKPITRDTRFSSILQAAEQAQARSFRIAETAQSCLTGRLLMTERNTRP